MVSRRAQLLPPPGLARGRIQRRHGLLGPDDELSSPALRQDDRRTVGERIIERLPGFFAGVLVKGDHTRGRLRADLKNQQLVFDQRRSRDARELFNSVFFRQVSFPHHHTLDGVETEEVPQCSEREQPAVPDARGGPGAARVRIESPVRVVHGILVAPEQFAGRFRKTEHALSGRGARYLGVGDVNPALGHDGAGPASSHRRAPGYLQGVRREGLRDAGFVPDAIAVRPAELRPIFRLHCDRQQQRQCQYGQPFGSAKPASAFGHAIVSHITRSE